MDRIAHFFVRRLRQVARREALRNAAANGLLVSWTIDDGAQALRVYGPAFDTSALTGDINRDMAWLRRRFGPGSDGRSMAPAPSEFDRHAYAVRLVGALAEPPSIATIAAALLLARAIAASGKPLRETLRLLKRPAPVVALHAPIAGFERAMTRMIETPGFLPGGALQGIDGDYIFSEKTFDVTDEPTRHYVSFTGENVHRLTGAAMRRRLVNALARNYPVVTITEKSTHIVDEITIAADLDLVTGKLDHAFVRSLIEVVYGTDGGELLAGGPNAHDIQALSLDDILLAFRPGREPKDVVEFLIRFAERERAAGEDGDDDDDNDTEAADRNKARASKGDAKASASRAAATSSASSNNNSGWKRDRSSGVEVIQPEPLPSDDSSGRARPLAVETLAGYGKAQTWALDLKADLADYLAARLAWSDMSTKLLLSGPPGTGKTTFARALCNSLGIPLVVTSVSTWLQGGHLNDVIDKMAKTFVEARALAPAILFVDEFDGIGKRQPAEREHADYWNTVVNKALELLDGATNNEGLIVVGATNRPEEIDDALKRSGRLETHIEIQKPDVAALVEILAHHLGDDVGHLADVSRNMAEVEPRLEDVPDGAEGEANLKGASR
ncbi:AAA family ATPase [Rhizobium sp. 16-449-1b]|uniref:AAA family ATPase n=1 Tax=Rhizobium sp. 16-449-1b TaxID=2819989 RepID=UPI001ADC17EE|nr:ATP-binding protein [Rhizobium sp. 16-449-1b]MBO9194844.1 AAA family ATPase [Rhizobium sp. 16-449-1b]